MLEETSEVVAEVVGKPSRSFFELCLASLNEEGIQKSDWHQVAIIGDDYKNDLGGGANELGLQRFLVRTGKYREGDETRAEGKVQVYDDFAGCIEHLLDCKV